MLITTSNLRKKLESARGEKKTVLGIVALLFSLVQPQSLCNRLRERNSFAKKQIHTKWGDHLSTQRQKKRVSQPCLLPGSNLHSAFLWVFGLFLHCIGRNKNSYWKVMRYFRPQKPTSGFPSGLSCLRHARTTEERKALLVHIMSEEQLDATLQTTHTPCIPVCPPSLGKALIPLLRTCLSSGQVNPNASC